MILNFVPVSQQPLQASANPRLNFINNSCAREFASYQNEMQYAQYFNFRTCGRDRSADTIAAAESALKV